MTIATILKNKYDGQLGTLEFSIFGGSVHWYEDGLLHKGLGERLDTILNNWDIVDLPEGYSVGEYGGVIKD